MLPLNENPLADEVKRIVVDVDEIRKMKVDLLRFGSGLFVHWKMLQHCRVDQIVQDLISKYENESRHIQSYQAKLHFYQTVFLNHARDIARGRNIDDKYSAISTLNSDSRQITYPISSIKFIDDIRILILRLNQEMDKLRTVMTNVKGVNSFAVLLFRIRLGITERVMRSFLEHQYHIDKPLSELIEWLQPWTSEDKNSTFKPGWPTIQTIWNELTLLISSNVRIDLFRELQQILQSVLPVDEQQTFCANRWYQWIVRCKTTVRDELGQTCWNDLFAIWFPRKKEFPT